MEYNSAMGNTGARPSRQWSGTPFADRADAGRKLAERLGDYAGEDTVVLALPRGGLAVAYEIAQALQAPLDVIVARKLGAPGQPELGIGAVAPGGVIVLDEAAIELLGVRAEEVARIAASATCEMDRRQRLYRGEAPLPDLEGRTVILVDDGLATGVTARAAIAFARMRHPRRLVLAAPVCAPETAERILPEVDDLVCLITPDNFCAVGVWYGDFEQVTNEEVVEMLEMARQEPASNIRAKRGALQAPAAGDFHA